MSPSIFSMRDQIVGTIWKNGKFTIRIRHVVAVNWSIFVLIPNLFRASTTMSNSRNIHQSSYPKNVAVGKLSIELERFCRKVPLAVSMTNCIEKSPTKIFLHEIIPSTQFCQLLSFHRPLVYYMDFISYFTCHMNHIIWFIW